MIVAGAGVYPAVIGIAMEVFLRMIGNTLIWGSILIAGIMSSSTRLALKQHLVLTVMF